MTQTLPGRGDISPRLALLGGGHFKGAGRSAWRRYGAGGERQEGYRRGRIPIHPKADEPRASCRYPDRRPQAGSSRGLKCLVRRLLVDQTDDYSIFQYAKMRGGTELMSELA